MTQKHPKHRRGFTLVEAVATIVILGSVMAVCARVISAATSAYTSASTRAELHSELTVAMERMMFELRSCRISQGGTFAPDVSSVGANSIVWNTPSGSRGLSVSGGSLLLTIDGTAATLMTGVTSFAVQTYDQSNIALGSTLNGTECVPVQRVEITLTGTRQGIVETLRSRIFLRCTAQGFSTS